jgi:membrane-bound lytic murein transglycosylase MltF
MKRLRSIAWLGAAALLALAPAGCGGDAAKPPADRAAAPAAAADTDAALPPSAVEAAVPEFLRDGMFRPFTGDLDAMVTRRLIRIGVPYNRTFYFVDKGVQRGAAYEFARAFEDDLNARLKTGPASRVHVVCLVVPRDRLAAALTEGRVDFVIAQVTVRPDLQAIVDFSRPTRSNVNEVVVTGPGAPVIGTAGDLSGKDVWVRPGGKYAESLAALNATLQATGKPPVVIRDAPANLEDDDILEMVNAGLIPITVTDDYLAGFWKKIFTNLAVHDTVAVREHATLAVPFRKNSPQLAAEINRFIAKYGLGTAFGNMMEKRYLVSTAYAKNATSESERKKFLALVQLFKKYSAQYDVDYLLMAAQGYQESGLNQAVKSPVGAIGIMQLMPATGSELQVGDITKEDANVHAGVKYMRFMVDRYYKDEPMDKLNKGLFTFASYNAGPGRVRQLRKEAAKRGLDPNVWFGNVEQIASERIGRETVTYVSNIYKYYVAYRMVADEIARRAAIKDTMKAPK